MTMRTIVEIVVVIMVMRRTMMDKMMMVVMKTMHLVTSQVEVNMVGKVHWSSLGYHSTKLYLYSSL